MQVVRASSLAHRARATRVGVLSRRSDQAQEKAWSAARTHRPSLSFRAMQGVSGTLTNYAIVKVCFRYVIYEAGNSFDCKERAANFPTLSGDHRKPLICARSWAYAPPRFDALPGRAYATCP